MPHRRPRNQDTVRAVAPGNGRGPSPDPDDNNILEDLLQGAAELGGSAIRLLSAPFRGETEKAERRRAARGKTQTAEGDLEMELRRRKQVRDQLLQVPPNATQSGGN
jgi:hypothetical protein